MIENKFEVIDAHCHIYPEKIASKAVESIGNFYDIPMVCGGTVSDMVSAEKKAGVTHCIVFSVATKPAQIESINNFIADEGSYTPDDALKQNLRICGDNIAVHLRLFRYSLLFENGVAGTIRIDFSEMSGV